MKKFFVGFRVSMGCILSRSISQNLTPTRVFTGIPGAPTYHIHSLSPSHTGHTGTISPDLSLDELINRFYKEGFTIHNTRDTFDENGYVLREVMAKFVAVFMIKKQRKWTHNHACGFVDIYQANSEFIPFIITACTMNIMRGTNNHFHPKQKLSKAEAIAIIMRMIRNDIKSNVTPRYMNYYTIARAYGITKDSFYSMEKHVTRGDLVRLFQRAYTFVE